MEHKNLIKDVKRRSHHVAHIASEPVHLIYFLFVGIESHGVYGAMAVVCLVTGLIHLVTDEA